MQQTGWKPSTKFRKIKNIDLVIMDIQLPEMDGFEATRIIRSMNSNIPVIAQTAFAMSDDKEKMKQAGFDDYVSKPIDINQLLAIVHRWLTRSKTRVTTPSSETESGYCNLNQSLFNDSNYFCSKHV